MRIKRIAKYSLLIFSVFIVACKSKEKPAEDGQQSAVFCSVTDFRGKVLSFDKKPQRIVCLIESALSGLYMLQADSMIVGVPASVYQESVAGYYRQMDERILHKTLSSPGNWDFVSIEKVLSLQPDLVIIWSSQKEAIASLEDKGIKVYGVFLKSFDDVYKEMTDFGILTQKEKRADTIITYTRKELQGLREVFKNQPVIKKRGYFSWAQGMLETAGNKSTVNELMELAAVENVCTASKEQVSINMEQLLIWNPDVIFLWYDAKRSPEDVMQMPQLKNISAIENKSVYEVPSVFWCDLWTLKFQYTAKLFAQYCYPQLFIHLNPEEERIKISKMLYGREISL